MDLKNSKIYACEDHIDLAMDEFINDNETFPELIDNTTEKCSFCDNNSKYEIK